MIDTNFGYRFEFANFFTLFRSRSKRYTKKLYKISFLFLAMCLTT